MTDQLQLCVQDIQDILEEDGIDGNDFDADDIFNHVKPKLKYTTIIIRNSIASIKQRSNVRKPQ